MSGGVMHRGSWGFSGGGVVFSLVVSACLCSPVTGNAQEPGAVSAELRALYEADQADRRFSTPPTDEQWSEISARDAVRQARVYELLRADRLSVAEDYYHAAMVLQHGDGSEDILMAHILATAAAFLGDDRGRWLSAAAMDRYLLRTRMPQRFGTQYVRASHEDPFEIDEAAPWSQGPYVRWLPDSIRGIFGVIPLAEQDQQTRSMNRGPGGEAPSGSGSP